MKKPKKGRDKILFISGVNKVTRERAQSFLTHNHIQRIAEAYRTFDSIDGFAQVAGNDEIREKGSNLSIPLYVRSNSINHSGKIAESQAPYGDKSLKAAIDEWQQSSADLRESMEELFKTLQDPTSS